MEKSVKQLYANIGKLITSSLKFEKILEGIMNEIYIFFNPENWSLLRLDEITNELFFVIFNGPVHLSDVRDIRLRIGEGIAGMVAEKKMPYFVPDTSKEKSFSRKVDMSTGFITKSIIAVPLICRNKVYGVIEIVNPADGTFFSEEEFIILQTIADFSAIAFANATLYEDVIRISYTDSLTGVYNRHKFNQIISQWASPEPMNRRRPEKQHISAIVVDLNNFKEINDTYGHMAGDSVLKAAAAFFKNCIREDDTLFRIGGDEFIILLQCETDEQLIAAQTRIIGLLEKGNRLELLKGFNVSYSIGYATGRKLDITKVIEKADSHMYLTKKKNNPSDK